MIFFTIASGSSGNAYFLGLGGRNYLIDAGISCKRIVKELAKHNINEINGVFITHEHTDHVSGAGVIARRFKADLYATPLTWRYFLRHKTLGPIEESQAIHIEPGVPIHLAEGEVKAFDIPHDAVQPVGYSFFIDGKKICLATDLGSVSDTVRAELADADLVVIESNHDPEMLARCRYHKSLKERVASKRGHLSNAQAGMLLSEVAVPGKTHAFLAHLSEESNTPMLAFDTVLRVLEGNEKKVASLTVAERHVAGEVVRLG